VAQSRQIRTLFSPLDMSFLLHLCAELEQQRDIRLTCVLRRSAELLQVVRELQPDILLLDCGAHDQHQRSLLETIRTTAAHTKVILFFDCDAQDAIIDALEHGVRGCLLKTCSPECCLRAIRAVDGGDMWAGRKALAQLLDSLMAQVRAAQEPAVERIPGLTLRELEVVVRIKGGMTNKEVARQLGISETTVKTHLQHVFHKLHISRRVELWHRALGSAPLGMSLMR